MAAGLSLSWLFTNTASAANNTSKEAARLVDNPFIGTIALFAFDFAPVGWMPCDGRLLSISNYNTLYSLISNNYGGDGRTKFALPDLRGRVPLGAGPSLSGTTYQMGEFGGSESNSLSESQLPSHSHTMNVSGNPGSSHIATGNLPATNRDGILHYGTTADNSMGSEAISPTGSGQPVNNMQPYLSLNYCIAVTTGFYPTRL
ncbi:MAG: tail fiber protein [Balneolaceae bacterium]|nr:tail fiber protein [Balneolaceae bacterium]MDR9408741.1 tail fiber protein [Balneolaceae bacterium]